MPTPSQFRALHAAKKEAKLNDLQAGLVLRNVAGVGSATELDNAAFEDVMAVFEDHGATGHPAGPTYWRDKVARRGNGRAGERAVYKIVALAAASSYDLGGLCERFSAKRTRIPTKLRPEEAGKLIEMLKAEAARRA